MQYGLIIRTPHCVVYASVTSIADDRMLFVGLNAHKLLSIFTRFTN